MRKKSLIFFAIVAIIFTSSIIIIKYCYRDRHYDDVVLTDTPHTIQECVNTARQVLNIDSSVHPDSVGMLYNNIYSKSPKVGISFIDERKNNIIAPYIYYTIDIDTEAGKATNISKEYWGNFPYDGLFVTTDAWNLDLDNAFNVPEILRFINDENVNPNYAVITAFNRVWTYWFNDGNDKNLSISIDPTTFERLNY